MENEQTEFTLPPAPRGLCFDRNDFIRTTFSVDSFLCDDQKSLETIRDDLGVYLKVLRLAMIELINKDYANFVNLSATLIGFDKAIEKIQLPLGQLNEEVMAVKECLDDAMKELSMWLNQRNALRKKKELLRFYSLTLNSLTVVKNVLNTLHDKHMREKIALVDRCAMQYNQLKFVISKCENLVKTQQKQEFIEIGDRLYDILDELLFYFWHESDEENLLNTLVTLSSLDRVAETEEIIRNRAVAPHLAEIINESFLQKSQNGLKGIYDNVLILLDSKLKLLFTTMEHPNLSFLVRRYRFLINCFWYEVETRLEVNLASIFAPGNPKIFYMRYCESMKFMKKLETYCSDRETVNFLRRTSQYKSFMKRWNLPVYFQIRFQEIAGNFEASLQQSPTHENENGFLIKETNCCWKAIQECWSDGIYIEALAHRFWKLSLQLISRYVTWVNTFCAQKPPKSDLSTICRDLIHDSVNIYLDIQTLLQRLPQFFSLVQSKIDIHDKFGDILSDSLKSSQEILMMAQKNVRNSIVTEISGYFNAQLKQVSDIPRLYRKTNRSMPSRPCTYIDTIVKTAHELSQDSFQRLDSDYLVQLYHELFHSITSSYYKYVEDVLISVKKTEDSLRRLKQIRDGTPQQASETGVTDGEKIRLQLNVDVVAYGKLIESFKLDANNIEKFKELNHIVKEAVKNIEIK